jgi:hypothetical protein
VQECVTFGNRKYSRIFGIFMGFQGFFFYLIVFAQKVIKRDSRLSNNKNKICHRQLPRHVTFYNGYQANWDFREC